MGQIVSQISIVKAVEIQFINIGMDNKQSQENSHPIVAFLQSDITLNITIVLSFIGMIIMAIFIFYLEGMAKVHLSVVTFLFVGLSLSLLYFKSIKQKDVPQSTLEQEEENKKKE